MAERRINEFLVATRKLGEPCKVPNYAKLSPWVREVIEAHWTLICDVAAVGLRLAETREASLRCGCTGTPGDYINLPVPVMAQVSEEKSSGKNPTVKVLFAFPYVAVRVKANIQTVMGRPSGAPPDVFSVAASRCDNDGAVRSGKWEEIPVAVVADKLTKLQPPHQ